MRNPTRKKIIKNGWSALALPGLAGIVFFACCGTALGQAGSKESQKFIGYSEDARETIADARSRMQKTFSHYNALVLGEAKKPQSTYKDLTKALDRTEKLVAKARSQVEKMQAQAEKVFSEWQLEIDGYQSENLRQLGTERLEVTRQRYEQMIERMRAAGEVYDSVFAPLHDQVLFMGRDLSPEALGSLTEIADELNRTAEKLYARVSEVLEEEQQDEVLLADDAATARQR